MEVDSPQLLLPAPSLSTGGGDEECSPSSSTGLSSHCVSTTFIDSLPEPFLGIARECIPPYSSVGGVGATKEEELLLSPSIRADLLEIQLRSHLIHQIQESLQDTDDTDNVAWEDVGLFWNCALELCCHIVYFSDLDTDPRYRGMSVRKLPMLLLEDALDALPLSAFQKIWEHNVEPVFPLLLSGTVLWKPSPQTNNFPIALPFIKLCNKFLKRLTAAGNASGCSTTDSEWAGRILMTLAKAFPLSDKSATKLWGSFNTENVTEFETQGQFLEQQNHQNETQGPTTLHHPRQSRELQSYSFYETFWSVQQDFSNPTGIKVADFLDRMRTIMAALESHPLIRSQQQQQSTTTSTSSTTNDNSTSLSSPPSIMPPVKYLTSSHLLPIQLGDPIFRIQFLTQFLIVENHLSSESSALGTALLPLQRRAKELMRHIQPLGATHLQIVTQILTQRETHWRQWKKTQKCQPDFETPFTRDDDDDDDQKKKKNDDEETNKKKRRLLDQPLVGAVTPKKKKKDEVELLIDFILHDKKDLKATCALSSSNNNNNGNDNKHKVMMPSLEDHLSPYVDALDPDAGIEPEYHPKNDALFTWRAIRLLSRDHLEQFHMINHKGDFEQMVRHIYSTEKGIQIPGEYVPPEELSLPDDEGEQPILPVLLDTVMDDTLLGEEGEEVAVASAKEEEPLEGEDAAYEEEELPDTHDQVMEDLDGNNDDDAVDNDNEMQQEKEESTPLTLAEAQERATGGGINDERNEPTFFKDYAAFTEEENAEKNSDRNAYSGSLDTSMNSEPAPSHQESSEGVVVAKKEVDSEDEGEIEEGKAGKLSEADASASATGEGMGPGIIARPQPDSGGHPKHETVARGNQVQHQQQHSGRREDERSGDGKPKQQLQLQEQQRRGAPAGKGKLYSLRPTDPPPHGSGSNSGSRSDDRHDGPQGLSSYADHRDHGRGHSRQHSRGGGNDGPQRGGNRDHGQQGGRGGPSRPGDDKWEDRRGSGAGGGGGSGGGGGGPGRRDDRRSGGGGGQRQGDRRGGRGGDQRRRYN
jgi:THO complex subunit 1